MKHAKLSSWLLAGVVAARCCQACADPADPTARAPEVIADARCVIVGISMGSVPGVAPQTAGLMLAFYYLGRLDGHSPKPDLEALLGDEAEKMTPDVVKSETVRCGAEFKEMGKQLTAIGQRITEREKGHAVEKKQQKQ